MPEDVFANLIPDPANNKPGRLISVAKTPDNEPIVKITPNPPPPDEKDILELSFVRSTEEYPFQQNMKNFLCYAHREGYKKVKLEDNALFSKGGCMYNALFYRVLNEKKPSLYVGFGFQPNAVAYPPASLESAKNTLHDSTIAVGKQLIPFLRETGTKQAYPEFHKALDSLGEEEDDTKKFGKWIVTRDCEEMRQLLNKIEGLASKHAGSPIPGLQGDALAFINAWRFYGKAHEILYRVPDCPGGGSRLRPRKRTSSRRRHKRRITRASRHHRKGSHRTRTAHKKISRTK